MSCGLPLRVICRHCDELIPLVIGAQQFSIVTFSSCWLTLYIEHSDLSQIALQIIGLSTFRISRFGIDGLIGSIEEHSFNQLALRIVFESCLDIALVIVFWLACGTKIALLNNVPAVIT